MKKIVFIFATAMLLLAALSVFEVNIKIYSILLRSLSFEREVSVYTDDQEISRVLNHISFVTVMHKPQKAKFLILSKSQDVAAWADKKPVLVTKYYLLRTYPKVLGGFFWHKGRPNIILLKSSLNRFHIRVSSSLNEYVEDRE